MYQPEKLKARRKELKKTQKDIADQLGVSYQAYSAWERGVKQPSREKVQQLEQILNVPKGFFTEIEIVRLYNTLSDEGKNNALNYVRNLVQKEAYKNVVSISAKLYEYHVYEKMSAGIGSTVYNDQDYNTVYFDKELAQKNEAPIPYLLAREFDQEKPLEAIVTDLTYVRVGNRWAYVCLIIDLFNREIIGLSVGWHKTAELVKQANQSIPYALTNVKLFHSDRGKEFDNQLIDEMRHRSVSKSSSLSL